MQFQPESGSILPEKLESQKLAKAYEEALARLEKEAAQAEAMGRRPSVAPEQRETVAMSLAKNKLASEQAAINEPQKRIERELQDTIKGPRTGLLDSLFKKDTQQAPVAPAISRLAAERPVLDETPAATDKKPEAKATAPTLPADPKKAKEQVKVISQVTENAIADIDNKKDQSPFAARLKALQDLEDGYWNEYKQNKGRTEFLQAMETIGLAFAQLGAGIQGQRTGVDLSGLKFNRVDWEKKIDTLMDELKQGLQRTSSAKKAIADEQQFKEGQQFREAERKATQAFQASEAAKDRALREKELGAQREAKVAAADEKAADARRREIEKQLPGIEAMEQAIAQLESPDVSDKSKRELLDKLPALSKAAGVAVGVPGKTGGFLGFGQSDDFSKMKAELEGRRQSLLSGGQPQASKGTITRAQLDALMKKYNRTEQQIKSDPAYRGYVFE